MLILQNNYGIYLTVNLDLEPPGVAFMLLDSILVAVRILTVWSNLCLYILIIKRRCKQTKVMRFYYPRHLFKGFFQ